MRRKKLLTGLLATALLVANISPAGAMAAEVPEEIRAEQLMMFDETELQKEEEDAVTAGEDVKSVEADENGFVIEDGVLTDYTGDGGDVTIPDEVTSIGDNAFASCYDLTNITIPESVTSIGDNAFAYCNNLINITIPDGVTSIGAWAFFCCFRLTNITIPNGVTSIGYRAFGSCSSLIEIKVLEGNENYSSEQGILYNKDKSLLIQCPGGKTGEVIIPDTVTSIEYGAFGSCDSLTNITIPVGVTSIESGAFNSCRNLIEITVLEGNENYSSEQGILYNKDKSLLIQCPGGKTGEVIIPDTVTGIGDWAFYNCDSLSKITIPVGVMSIESCAFSSCNNLIEITVLEGNENYSSEQGILYNKDKSLLIQCPGGKTGEVIIPDTVMSIGDWAFYYCSSITDITIPVGVTSIGDSAFCFCRSLINVTIPSGVTNIGDDAFEICSEDLIIYCVRDSYAETYAKENNIRYRYIGEKDTQTITTASDNITKTFGDSAFSIGAVTDGNGTLSYVSDNEAVVKVDSAGIITLVGAGTAHITITASETDTYKAAEKVITITVEKKAQTITASDITKTFGEAAFPLNAAVDGDGTLTYVSDNTSVATVDANGIVTLVNAGTIHIAIKASETTNYKAAEKIITVTVNPAETPSEKPEKNEQTITAKNITKTYGDKAFSLGAKTNGGGKLTYKISNTKIATIDKKGKVTIKGCGRTQIKITAAANGNYQKATKTITLTVKPKKVAVTSVKSTKSKAVTVKWKQDKKAKGYIVEYSTDKKFKKNVKTVTISKNSTVSKTVTKLKGGKKYYVRVCAYTTADGKKIKGSYSKVMNVKVKK